eukprot:m.7421 g.7421  ORF g.7421 m.7421 type:complete len:127 (+) comp6701_c0_seq1:56-436(+)
MKLKGSCHCQAVQFEVEATPPLRVIRCSCSICVKKQNHHFIVKKSNFKLLRGEENLTLYQFNTKMAKHLFCKTCGVQAFYTPRSNPDGYGVALYALDERPAVEWEDFDGQNWEQNINEELRGRSKE